MALMRSSWLPLGKWVRPTDPRTGFRRRWRARRWHCRRPHGRGGRGYGRLGGFRCRRNGIIIPQPASGVNTSPGGKANMRPWSLLRLPAKRLHPCAALRSSRREECQIGSAADVAVGLGFSTVAPLLAMAARMRSMSPPGPMMVPVWSARPRSGGPFC